LSSFYIVGFLELCSLVTAHRLFTSFKYYEEENVRWIYKIGNRKN